MIEILYKEKRILMLKRFNIKDILILQLQI